MCPSITEAPGATPVQVGDSAPSFLTMHGLGSRNPTPIDVRLLRFYVKRLTDVCGSIVLALVVGPLMICITLLLWMRDIGGPVLYRQERVGRGGRTFICLKFRSMCRNADSLLDDLLARDELARIEWTAMHKLKNDPRISGIGRFLRSTSLDELPQLWNVFVGDMSLVGPRPITQDEVDGQYTQFDGHQQYLAVRPGLTGLWQVSGRSAVSYERRVEFDKIYVRDLSLRRDALILWQTIWVVLRRDGAC